MKLLTKMGVVNVPFQCGWMVCLRDSAIMKHTGIKRKHSGVTANGQRNGVSGLTGIVVDWPATLMGAQRHESLRTETCGARLNLTLSTYKKAQQVSAQLMKMLERN